MKKQTKATLVTTKNGLLYRHGEMIQLPEADIIAQEHGYQYAEHLVRALEWGCAILAPRGKNGKENNQTTKT